MQINCDLLSMNQIIRIFICCHSFKNEYKYVLNVSESSHDGFVDIVQHFIATLWVNLLIKFS